MSPRPTAPNFTPKQGQYLSFIYAYTHVLGRPPAEADLQRHFGVSPPSVHQMALTLERTGLIRRKPGVARSIEVLIAPELLRSYADPFISAVSFGSPRRLSESGDPINGPGKATRLFNARVVPGDLSLCPRERHCTNRLHTVRYTKLALGRFTDQGNFTKNLSKFKSEGFIGETEKESLEYTNRGRTCVHSSIHVEGLVGDSHCTATQLDRSSVFSRYQCIMLKSLRYLVRCCRLDRFLERRLAGLNRACKTFAKHAYRTEFHCSRKLVAAARAGALGLRAHGSNRPSSTT